MAKKKTPKTIAKPDLIEAIVKKGCCCTKKETCDCVDAVIDEITKALTKGWRVTLTGFGTFSVSKRGARIGRNPRTGATIKIPAVTVPKFKAGKRLKEAVR